MKRSATFAGALALMIGAAAPVFAADLYGGGLKDNGAGVTTNWSGLYVGVNGGYIAGANSGDGIADKWLFGGTAGLNLQKGNIVGGIETDLAALAMPEDVYAGTVRGRLGFATGNVLLYGTGGYAYAGATCAGCFVDGWAAGFGAEWKFDKQWSVKTEWLHTELGTAEGNMPPADVIRMGVNFHVTSFAPLP